MYDDFDDDLFLGPEALVSLYFDEDDWDVGHADTMEHGSARGASGPDGSDASEEDPLPDVESDAEVGTAVQRLLTLSWA